MDDIPLEQQSKLLRAIEEKVYERVGGTTPIKADVRIIASTKRNLLEKIGEGTFRQDLYYRLDVLRIVVPPLRERMEDVPLLAEHLLKEIAGECLCEVEPGALDRLLQHNWPGNVRELTHALERAYLIGSGHITADVAGKRNGRHCRAGCPRRRWAAERNRPAISRPPWTRPSAICWSGPCGPPAATRRPPPPRWA